MVPAALLLCRDLLCETDQRAPVVGQRAQRYELIRAVVAVSDRAELDGRDPLGEECGGLGTSVAADELRPFDALVSQRLVQRHHKLIVVGHVGRLALEEHLDGDVLDLADVDEDLLGILARDEANVDVHLAGVGNLVDGVAALDAAEVDARPVEHLAALAREVHALDAAEDVVRLEHGVVAEPGRGTVRRRAADGDSQREHPLGLHPDVKIGGLAGDREVAAVAALDQNIGAADPHRLRLLVGDAEEAHLHALFVAQIAQRAHHRRESRLHVVGATTDKRVALDARLELTGLAGDDVDVAVEDQHRTAPLGARDDHGEAGDFHLLDLEAVGLEPALDEADAGRDPLGARGVVRHQALGEVVLVHARSLWEWRHDQDTLRPPPITGHLVWPLTNVVSTGDRGDRVSAIALLTSTPGARKLTAGPEGTFEYDASHERVTAIGSSWTSEELDAFLRDHVLAIIWDEVGAAELATFAAEIAETQFESSKILEILQTESPMEPWRISEAIAEAFFIECRACAFPWPDGRDNRTPNASLPGADLVGFVGPPGQERFAFGEVKSSSEDKAPPNVAYGKHGLVAQLEHLRDDGELRRTLMAYLAFRAQNADWKDEFKQAMKRYANDERDFALFGFLVRDTSPDSADLASRALALSNTELQPVTIELRAKYLPEAALEALTERVMELAADAGYA